MSARGARRAASLPLKISLGVVAFGLAFSLPVLAPGLGTALAQSARPPAAAARSVESREVDAYLTLVQQVRSGCENAAWSLWHSNSYEGWRKRRSSALSMNYSGRFFENMPSPPGSLPDALRGRLSDAMAQANDKLRGGGAVFKDLANYINAKDYEDDKFKKGDELNAKLLGFGRECHELYATLTGLYVELAEGLIERGQKGAARPEIAASMAGDWRRARELSRELAKHGAADFARLDTLVRDVSALAEERKQAFEPALGASGAIARFYDRTLNEAVAVRMRKLLREARSNPKEGRDAAADRPRSPFWQVRGEIDYAMPDAILSFIRQGN